jgi:hypothetical protein
MEKKRREVEKELSSRAPKSNPCMGQAQPALFGPATKHGPHKPGLCPTLALIKSPKARFSFLTFQPKSSGLAEPAMCNAFRSRLSNRDSKRRIVLRRLNRSTISYTEASLLRRYLEDPSGCCCFLLSHFPSVLLPSPNCSGSPLLSSCRDTFSETTICLPLCSFGAQ